MAKTLIYTVLALCLMAGMVIANDLSFPQTESEIVALLSKDMNTSLTASNGTKYIAERGMVYKIINGRRFRLRGLQVVEAIDILPKAGALINFDFDSASINADSLPLLNEFGNALKNSFSDALILIAGHTDSKGSNEYNQNLSEMRAEAVVEYLTESHGISPATLRAKGFGETQPIAANDTEEHRLKNRRVEFVRIE